MDVGRQRRQVGVKLAEGVKAELRRRLARPNIGGPRPEQAQLLLLHCIQQGGVFPGGVGHN